MVRRPTCLLLLLAACAAPGATGPSPSFPVPAVDWAPRSCLCLRAPVPLRVDGRLDEDEWGAAPWTEDFLDIRGPGHPEPGLRTRAKLLWDDEHLYVAAELEEPDLWATYTRRDSVVFHENDFELFLDPDGDTHLYFELEVNVLGTEWDLLLTRPYRDSGTALHAYDLPGLRTAVRPEGTVNDPSDRDRGWTVEIALPFAALAEFAGRPSPPRPGDRWRLNFSRVQWDLVPREGGYAKDRDPETGEPRPEHNWVWSPQGLVAMHYPEMWGFLEFSDRTEGAGLSPSPPLPEERAAWALRREYYGHRTRHPDGAAPFRASRRLPDGRTARIDGDGRVTVVPRPGEEGP